MTGTTGTKKRRLPEKDVSWWQNLRRWSTQLHLASVLLSVYELLPVAVDAVLSGVHLYQPLLSDAQYATIVVGLNVLGAVVRNLKQNGVS